ncbi:MAG: sulfatase-like hydrolase/transferase [Planctomycetaceae bacterium]|nr:sulfatase-like hydrolase/transferase [Planctomycetales bacterium]MCB9927596.1 sulfatase-like hydrolase/transferase [Planctomycetaceae bacterium]
MTCLAIATLFGVLVIGASSAANDKRPNVLFLLTDDQRPDTIHELGNASIDTPNLDALARRGVSFTRAVCANPICTPSRAEILSGCSGFRNGVIDFGKTIDPALKLWPQTMTEAGYHSWYVGKWHNDGKPVQRGYEQTLGLFTGGGGKWWKDQVDWKGTPVTGYRGWVFQDDEQHLFPERGVGLTPDISGKFADAAIEFIRSKPIEPFFLQVAFTAPHDPLYFPPNFESKYAADELPLPENFLPEHPFDHGNFDGRDEQLLPWPRTPKMIRELLAVYYAVISDMDHQVGRIVAALRETGQFDNTIIIFSSDHGLGVGSHGLRGKQSMYEHTINVPLVIAGPGIPQGQVSEAQVYLRELYPTTCDLVGIKVPNTVEGKSFAKIVKGDSNHTHNHVFCYFRDKQRMVRDSRWKLIHYPAIDRWQLFDLEADPYEMSDLSKDETKANVMTRLRDLLHREQVAAADPLAAD